jgi:hypothetical protein
MTMYDADGNVTTSSVDEVCRVYYITLNNLITGTTASSISVVKTTTKSTIKVDLPSEVQVSSTPLDGYFRVKCIDPEGYESYSNNIHSTRNAESAVQNAIMDGCDRMYDTVEVFWANQFTSRANGISYLIRFMGLN